MIFLWLLAAFILVPILELAVLLQVGRQLGAASTLALVVLTGITGAWLVKLQGLLVMTRIRREFEAGRLPAPQMLDGAMILLAGVLLVTPGLLTDTLGFALLTPPFRAFVRNELKKRLSESFRDSDPSDPSGRPVIDLEG